MLLEADACILFLAITKADVKTFYLYNLVYLAQRISCTWFAIITPLDL